MSEEEKTMHFADGSKVTFKIVEYTEEEKKKRNEMYARLRGPVLTALEDEIADCFDIPNGNYMDAPKLKAVLAKHGIKND